MASSRYFPTPVNNEDHFEINTNGIKNLITSCSQNKLNPKIIFVNSGASKLHSNEDNNGYTFSKKKSSEFFHKSIENKNIKATNAKIVWANHPSRINQNNICICTLCNSPTPEGEIKRWGKCSFCWRKINN